LDIAEDEEDGEMFDAATVVASPELVGIRHGMFISYRTESAFTLFFSSSPASSQRSLIFGRPEVKVQADAEKE
jgi:hypothetical protein